jgi:hypothetical protein
MSLSQHGALDLRVLRKQNCGAPELDCSKELPCSLAVGHRPADLSISLRSAETEDSFVCGEVLIESPIRFAYIDLPSDRFSGTLKVQKVRHG